MSFEITWVKEVYERYGRIMFFYNLNIDGLVISDIMIRRGMNDKFEVACPMRKFHDYEKHVSTRKWISVAHPLTGNGVEILLDSSREVLRVNLENYERNRIFLRKSSPKEYSMTDQKNSRAWPPGAYWFEVPATKVKVEIIKTYVSDIEHLQIIYRPVKEKR